jgi:proline iminopeptidase
VCPNTKIRSGFLSVDDTHEIYWEESGNPKGKPALYLHGGPGSGSSPGYRKHFDPEKYRIISLDQRGCGKSKPLVTSEGYDLSSNNTTALIEDIEKLRSFLNVKKWLLLGVSWGTTLALRYAQAHPENISEMVLMCVTTTSKEEVDWITEGMQAYFP